MIQLIIVMAILFYNPQCEPEIQGQTKGEIQQEEKQSRISSSQMIFETIKTQSESIDVICNISGSILLQMIGQLFKISQH